MRDTRKRKAISIESRQIYLGFVLKIQFLQKYAQNLYFFSLLECVCVTAEDLLKEKNELRKWLFRFRAHVKWIAVCPPNRKKKNKNFVAIQRERLHSNENTLWNVRGHDSTSISSISNAEYRTKTAFFHSQPTEILKTLLLKEKNNNNFEIKAKGKSSFLLFIGYSNDDAKPAQKWQKFYGPNSHELTAQCQCTPVINRQIFRMSTQFVQKFQVDFFFLCLLCTVVVVIGRCCG